MFEKVFNFAGSMPDEIKKGLPKVQLFFKEAEVIYFYSVYYNHRYSSFFYQYYESHDPHIIPLHNRSHLVEIHIQMYIET